MKTNLERQINTVEDAEAFLSELHENGESFHPEDSAFDISWSLPADQVPSADECRKLNELMAAVFDLEDGVFDACEYLLSLDADENERMKQARPEEF